MFQKGKRAYSPTLLLLYRPAKENAMAISIGKKHGKSVRRNRVKRLLREVFRRNLDTMQGKYSIILVPKVAEEYSFADFDRDMQWIIQKEKL